MIQILIEPILTIAFVGVGYVTGFLPTLVLFLGKVDPGPIEKAGDFKFYRSKGMKWWHSTYTDNGRCVLPAESVALIGWGILTGLFLSLWGIFHLLGF